MPTNPSTTCIDHPEVEALEKQIGELKRKLAELRRKHCDRSAVKDYVFATHDGRTASLSQLFGDKPDLIVIHNMGKHCAYCTLWADGFNGLVPHFEDRAGFVVISNDPADVQKQFADARGWKFRMVSSAGTSFFHDMGFEAEANKTWPGASMFHKSADGNITRTGHSYFGPGDDFCSAWHLFELLDGGTGNWQPKFHYTSAPVQLGVKDGPH